MLATLRKWCLPFLACLVAARAARAADDDPLAISSAPSTIRAHEYSLAECMALAESNFPTLWAARARLAYAHAQLDEAKWTPWSQWTANSTFGVAPPLLGSVIFPQSSLSATNITSVNALQPFFKFHVEGVIPVHLAVSGDLLVRLLQRAGWSNDVVGDLSVDLPHARNIIGQCGE